MSALNDVPTQHAAAQPVTPSSARGRHRSRRRCSSSTSARAQTRYVGAVAGGWPHVDVCRTKEASLTDVI